MTFKARVVHATRSTFRLFVTVDVRDPMDPSKLPARSNRLMFVFVREAATSGDSVDDIINGGSSSSIDESASVAILPQTYSELLMHCEAARRYDCEGPDQAEIDAVFADTDSIE